jgi:3-methyl-2-oxobutanoate hydroxymethyltransferase
MTTSTKARKRPTVADLKALKGKKQLTMLRYFSLDEAAAAEAAGIDVASVPPDLVSHPRYRELAPTVFSMTGTTHLEYGVAEDYLRYAGKMLEAGADALYCSGSLQTVEYLAREYIPIVGHVGLVPSRATWTGGFRAVGKSAKDALALFEECRRYQDAGAFAVEIEVVPVEVATAISARLDLLLWSMGSGPGCDAQYLFAEDILGENKSRLPRHAKAYRNFAAEYERLQNERVKAFAEFRDDVASGAFPEAGHVVRMEPAELEKFLKGIGG